MKQVKDYWFRPTDKRINGFIYILDGNDKFVAVNGKLKRFKSTDMCAKFIYRIEMQRDIVLGKARKEEV